MTVVPMQRNRSLRWAGVVLILLGLVWVGSTFRRGKLVVDPEGVTIVLLTRPGDGEKDVLPNAFISADLNAGHAIDPGTLTNESVRLFRVKDNEPIPADVNTSGAGDAIVLQPQQMLEPRTAYRFEVTKKVRDRGGLELMPYVMTFTTGGGDALKGFPVAFEKVELPVENEHVTSLAIGPDGRLYAASGSGHIIRFDVQPDGMLAGKQVIATLVQHNKGPRLITGICFDPAATKENPVLWVSHGQFLLNQRGEMSSEGYDDWTGKITRLSGKDLAEYRDVIVNLPRSWRDHLNNQIAFGPDGALYWSQGSHTAMGAPDSKWGHRTERLLSAAILRADVKAIGEKTVDVKTDEGGKYDPFAAGAPVTIYASGVRVAYDMLWHSNGNLYAATNGSAMGGSVPGTPDGIAPKRIDEEKFGAYDGERVPSLIGLAETQDDRLLKVDRGAYYGHPNPMRGEYVLDGGNPTSNKDPLEIESYPRGTKPDRNLHLPVYSFGKHISPNGLLEYKGNVFGGALRGKILVTRFSGGKDILVLVPDAKGGISETLSGIAGLTQFQDPLDLAQDESTGRIYVAEFRGEKLALLRPVTDPARAAGMSQNVFLQKVK